MSTFFVDSSALGRRYLNEVGSAWVLQWLPKAAGHIILVSDLAVVELFATFARLQREGRLPAQTIPLLQNRLMTDMHNEYLTVPLDSPTLTLACQLTGRYPLRALDALQLACALRAVAVLGEPMIFVSGDNRLLTAAAAEGFTTDNPYWHP